MPFRITGYAPATPERPTIDLEIVGECIFDYSLAVLENRRVEIGEGIFRDGFLADFPADFNLSTQSHEVTSMSQYLVRSALLPSGPCPATILVSLLASDRILSATAIVPVILPPVLGSM
jgi:hypothetical protein